MPNLDKLADRIAHDYLCDCCIKSLVSNIGESIISELRKPKDERKVYFDKLFKRLEPVEAKFSALVRRHWAQQEKLIIANLKKLKKAHMRTKDAIDNVLPPKKEQEKKLAEEMKALLIVLLAEMGQETLDEMELAIAFDVTIPEVRKWVNEYAFHFAEKLEGESIDVIRRIIGDAMEEGKTIPEIIRDLREQFADWSKYRAERVARTETTRAATRANLEAWKQSGVVKGKKWFANPDACDWCLPLDGEVINLEENFYDIGSTLEMEVDGKTRTLVLDYEDVKGPPLHPNCRCSALPFVD